MKKNIVLMIIALMLLVGCGMKAEGGVISFSEPSELIEIDINTKKQNLPESKDDGELPVVINIKMGKERFKTHGTIKVQGSSTQYWPKKNWRFNFYSDKNLENKVEMSIGDSVSSDKWIAKAEWIDPSMLRNASSFKLWEAMVQSRSGEPKYEVDNALSSKKEIEKSGAQGFPKTYPARIKVNGEHYGTSILLLGHEPKNFNIDKENSNHIYMEFDARGGYTKVQTWEKFKSSGIGEWIDGYTPKNEKFTVEQKNAIDDLGELINGDLETFKDNFDSHLDRQNMIDMLLFLEMVYDWDAMSQDLEIVTYDLEKWYFLPWDKDTTFGMWWDGSGLLKNSESDLQINYEKENPIQKPWFKTYHAFTDDVEARYAQLRNENVFTVDNLQQITDSILNLYTDEIWEAEIKKWEALERPSVEEANQEQLLTWFEARLQLLDEHFNYKQ